MISCCGPTLLVMFPLSVHSEGTWTWTGLIAQVAIISVFPEMLGLGMLGHIELFLRRIFT